MQTVKVKAPAKINLYLNVLGKRPDGFHDIETIFEKIDLCDEIILKRRKKGIKLSCGIGKYKYDTTAKIAKSYRRRRFSCRPKGLPEDKRNLAFKAAQLALIKTKRRDGVQITLLKRTPVAAGLGGGSSDAAGVLLGLNKLLALGLSRDELLKLAAQLGADVPFFILPAIRAIGRGKGEILTPLKIKRKNWYVLVIPRLAISTRRMYRVLKMPLTKRPCGAKIVLRALKKGNLTSLNKYSFNSFERILRKRYKEIQEIKKALRSQGAGATLVSGSGPCVFGIAQTRKEAMQISKRLQAKSKDWQIIVTKTYNVHRNKEV